MRVRAIRTGFINGTLVSVGDEVEIAEKQFSKTWMESLEAPKPAKPPKAEKPAQAPAPEEI